MRFLRMLTNSMLAGALGSAYLTILVLQLNPDVPLASTAPAWWYVTLAITYGVLIAVTCYALIVAREFFAMGALSPGWASVRMLAWLGAALAAGAAVLMWLNVRGFETTLGEVAARRMTIGAIATSASAVVLLAIAIVHFSFGRPGSRVGAALFTLAIIASLALPLAARGAGAETVAPLAAWTASQAGGALGAQPVGQEPRVTVIALDGATLAYIMPRAAEGRLPQFSRMLDSGAVIDLATSKPTQPDPVWAAIATGMLPQKNGIRSAARYYARGDRRGIGLLPDHCLAHALVHVGLVRDVTASAAQWAARPLWGILSDAGVSTGLVRWPLTHPVQPLRGFVVSDRLHQFVGTDTGLDGVVYPSRLLPVVLEAADGSFVAASDIGGAAGFLIGAPEATALRRDLIYGRAARALAARERPRFLAVRYEGLDVVSHYYLRYTLPPAPRGMPEAERRRHAQIVDRYYAYIDAELGAVLDTVNPGDLVLVISGFGMERLSPAKELLSRVMGESRITGSHERAPDGFLLAYGTSVQKGRHPRGALTDVTPTLLYFFGLPVARDMDGFARSDLFTRDFTSERPITFIPSYR
jgi:hypothetical protein